VGHEECVDSKFRRYDSITYTKVDDEDACMNKCSGFAQTGSLIGFEYTPVVKWCYCLFDDEYLDNMDKPEDAATINTCPEGAGLVSGTEIGSVVLKGGALCYRYGPSRLKVSRSASNAILVQL